MRMIVERKKKQSIDIFITGGANKFQVVQLTLLNGK